MGLFSWFGASTADPDAIPKKTTCYHIEGFLSCAYFHEATNVADKLANSHPNVKVNVNAFVRDQWKQRSDELQKTFNTSHATSPFIYEGCASKDETFVGGYTDFVQRIKKTHPKHAL